MMNSPSNVLHTGGAHGGDQFWERIAQTKGHSVKEYQFDGHKHTRVLDHTGQHTLVDLTPDDKELCRMALETASSQMGRDLPSGAQLHLLERDWILVHNSDANSLYAVGHFDPDAESRLKIHGGTGWIMELFLEHYMYKHNLYNNPGGKVSFSIKPLPIYFKSMSHNAQFQGHYQLCLDGMNRFKWERVDQIPDPKGNWIGVGARS